MHVFYIPDISSSIHILPEEESKHCIRVLRLKKESVVYLIDGKGSFHKAQIIEEDERACKLSIINTQLEFNKRNFYLHIAIAPTKNIDRFEWFLEKSTEIGINEVTPIICEHSERREIKIDRLQKVIISAMKQSIRACLPKLNPIMKFTDFVNTNFSIKQKYIAHCNDKNEKHLLKNLYKPDTDILILIGPEGDFSSAEIIKAENKNFQGVSLGRSRLRTETAGIVACHTINVLNE